jgi:hypothetical protein
MIAKRLMLLCGQITGSMAREAIKRGEQTMVEVAKVI